MIMIRTLRRDIAKYNADEGMDEAIEETGWKLVHGDVFRPPRNSRLFAAVIGSGIQIFFMALITICECKMKYISIIFLKYNIKNKYLHFIRCTRIICLSFKQIVLKVYKI